MRSTNMALTHVDRVATTVQESATATLSPVAASWRRSMVYYGLDPARRSPTRRLSGPELDRAREKNGNLLEVARPSLERLYQTAGTAGCCVVLTDAEGVILQANSTAADRHHFAEWGLAEGAIWNEANEGTNGIGTCIAEKRPVVIFQNEHFRAQNIAMSCMGAPIYDPSGEIIAVLDVSNCRKDLTHSFAQVLGSVVTESARSVESELFQRAFQGARIIVAEGHGSSGVALLAVDEDDLVIGATRHARRRLGLSGEILQAMPSLHEVMAGLRTSQDRGRVEKGEIRRALLRRRGNVSAAARDLGISRATMYRRMNQLGILSEN
ncbi:GAF domain-containing protein [Roseibium sp.]|uniref:sigma-54-dependent Fis family transcriptional regulator n=1 Tax=Roseibium sp. TaxID=1936156 RepID=UPI003A980910